MSVTYRDLIQRIAESAPGASSARNIPELTLEDLASALQHYPSSFIEALADTDSYTRIPSGLRSETFPLRRSGAGTGWVLHPTRAEGIVVSHKAFRLAYEDSGEFWTSEYGYIRPDAATTAAPALNRTRVARGKAPYTHLVEFAGDRCLDVRSLEAA